ncbi:MAG: bifunctional UDP-sugar hydrolase/5'-nucleotidase [Candidatus Cloacimonadaceae bacterium]|nr:bifunctional UDP-sugar hydrolase/5'-nucleotidase [Candidatus Cloacimonadaceae bacterium]
MKKLLSTFVLILIYIQIFGINLRIFYTNDSHGTYLPRTYTIDGKRHELGGYSELESVLNIARAEVTRSIYLDAGDQQTGSAFSGLKFNDAVGGAVIEVFNLLKLDAACLGNHEFDISLANTKKLIELAKYPCITTNITNKQDNANFNRPYTIIETDSLRIGVLGLTLVELPEKVRAANVKDINILPYQEAIEAYIDEVHAKSDLIVLLTHNGFAADSLLATQLDDRISLIIGGHSHTMLPQAVEVNGILIVQTGAYLSHLGQIDIKVQNGRIVSHKNTLIPVQSRLKPPSTDLTRFVDRLRAEIEHNLNKVIGTLPIDWIPNKYQETEVSRWQALALRSHYAESFKPDVALLNCGGIRKAVNRGRITLKDMSEMLPFQNTVTLFSAKGKDIITFYDLNTKILPLAPNGIVQATPMGWMLDGKYISGTEIPEKAFFAIDGLPIDSDRTYRIITHDYLAGQWDKYLGFEPFDLYDTGDLLLDVMVEQVKLQFGSR